MGRTDREAVRRGRDGGGRSEFHARQGVPPRDDAAGSAPLECAEGGRLKGLKFRRQHPIGPYILDFYCAEAKLAVEVDGAGHDLLDQVAHDRRRTAWLAGRGIKVIRLRAAHVKDELEGVLGFILAAVRERRDDG